MKRLLFACLVAVLALAFSSCTNTKEVPYFQNIDDAVLAASTIAPEPRIVPYDELAITVNSSDPSVGSVFNLTVSRTSSSNYTTLSSQQALLTYIVDAEGNINFPMIGKIHVAGMTRTELEDHVAEMISPYFAEDDTPLVRVTITNFRVTILGEVSSPKVVEITSDKTSVIEALANAGDLGIYGKRKNLLVIREGEDGVKTPHRLDLTDANVMNDPYYYVQQNDIIYITPNKQKARNADIGTATTFTFTVLSFLMTLTNFLINVID